MLKKIDNVEDNVIAVDIVDSFEMSDVEELKAELIEKLKTHDHVNILSRMDHIDWKHVSPKAIIHDLVYALKNLKNMHKIAVVGDSNILKSAVKLDSLFYGLLGQEHIEKYFDIDHLDDAIHFVNTD